MKNRVVFIIYLLMAGVIAKGQGVGSILSQKQTDIKSLLKQVALWQVYIGDVEKGYNTAREGLKIIGEIKNGEFNLHSAFFNSLASVNPAVKKYSKVAEIISLQLSIANDFKRILAVKQMSPVEMNYLNQVYHNLMTECAKSLQELEDLITDNTFHMSDAERIKRIDTLYSDMKDTYAFTEGFSAQVNTIAGTRQAMENEIDELENLE